MVERPLSMREVRGSMPRFSTWIDLLYFQQAPRPAFEASVKAEVDPPCLETWLSERGTPGHMMG